MRYICRLFGSRLEGVNSGRGADQAQDDANVESNTEESHLRAAPRPCVNLSIHTAPISARWHTWPRLCLWIPGLLLLPDGGGFSWPRGLGGEQRSTLRSSPITELSSLLSGHSAPVLRIGTLVLAVLAA